VIVRSAQKRNITGWCDHDTPASRRFGCGAPADPILDWRTSRRLYVYCSRLPTAMPTHAHDRRLELLQGTLDMLVLRTQQWGAQHGHGIGQAIRQQSDDLLRVETGSLYPAPQRGPDKHRIASCGNRPVRRVEPVNGLEPTIYIEATAVRLARGCSSVVYGRAGRTGRSPQLGGLDRHSAEAEGRASNAVLIHSAT
jgi:hypothetical protein